MDAGPAARPPASARADAPCPRRYPRTVWGFECQIVSIAVETVGQGGEIEEAPGIHRYEPKPERRPAWTGASRPQSPWSKPRTEAAAFRHCEVCFRGERRRDLGPRSAAQFATAGSLTAGTKPLICQAEDRQAHATVFMRRARFVHSY